MGGMSTGIMDGLLVVDRIRTWCRHKAKDGRECALYLSHYGKHKDKHGHSEWDDGE